MNSYYKQAISSPAASLQFIVDTQYDSVLTRAIGARIVNSNVGPKNLYDVIRQLIDDNQVAQVNNLFDFQPSTEGLTPEIAEAVNMFVAKANNNGGMVRSVSPGGGGGGVGGGGGSNGAGGGFNWSSSNTDSAINTFGQIFTNLWGTFMGGGNDSPAPTDTPTDTPTPPPGAPKNYTPWLIGGGAVLVIIIIVAVVYFKRK